MKTASDFGFIPADILALRAMCEALFAEWYPDHRDGGPIPTMPPAHIMQEARELALQHRMAAARRRGQPTA